MAGFGVEESKLRRPQRFNVAITVENSERISVFQDASAIIGQRRSGANVICILNA
jgi:hypothetical protein